MGWLHRWVDSQVKKELAKPHNVERMKDIDERITRLRGEADEQGRKRPSLEDWDRLGEGIAALNQRGNELAKRYHGCFMAVSLHKATECYYEKQSVPVIPLVEALKEVALACYLLERDRPVPGNEARAKVLDRAVEELGKVVATYKETTEEMVSESWKWG